MFPLRDSQKTYKFPKITILLIVVNAVVFLLEITTDSPDAFIEHFALIPANVNFKNYLSLAPFLTSQFLHAGFLHIIGNMWFLKIFGDNVEEKFVSIAYLFIYLFSGVAGSLLQYVFLPGSAIPMLGASGAVAGVLGAYLVFFPRHKIETLVPLGLFMRVISLPASWMLIYWFVIQLFSGVGSFADISSGGVAFWAHVGGFATGYAAAKFLPRSARVYEAEEGELLN